MTDPICVITHAAQSLELEQGETMAVFFANIKCADSPGRRTTMENAGRAHHPLQALFKNWPHRNGVERFTVMMEERLPTRGTPHSAGAEYDAVG